MATEKASLDESTALEGSDGLPRRHPGRGRRLWGLLTLLVLVLSIAGYFGVQWWVYAWHHVSTDDARVKGTLITISTEVPGRLLKVLVEEGQTVKKGDLLAQIQPDTYELEVALRSANLEAVQSQLASAEIELEMAKALAEGQIQRSEAGLGTSLSQLAESQKVVNLEDQRLQANLQEKEAALEEARARLQGTKATQGRAATDLDRAQQLFREGVVAAGQRDQAQAAYELAQAQHQAAQETLNKQKAMLQMARAEGQKVQLSLTSVRTQERKVRESEAVRNLALIERQRAEVKEQTATDLRAKVKEAEAQLALARLRLSETRIVSPIDGIVSQAIADVGERVQPGQPMIIVNDPQDVWVSANIKETAIRDISVGQPVEISVDAYPGKTFQGTVEQVGSATRSEFAIIPAGSASAHFIKVTQRLPVKIAVQNRENLLKPGMMVEVGIQVR